MIKRTGAAVNFSKLYHLFVANLAILVMSAGHTIQGAEWTIIEDQSLIELEGTINKKPRTVTLPTFSGTVSFDKDELETSNVDISITIADLSDDLPEAVKTLHDAQWFNQFTYEFATFQATDFEMLEDGTYRANGELTIKDHTEPTTLDFTFDHYGPDPDNPEQIKTVMNGTAMINRFTFALGESWNKDFPTYKIGEDVQVNVTLTAVSPVSDQMPHQMSDKAPDQAAEDTHEQSPTQPEEQDLDMESHPE